MRSGDAAEIASRIVAEVREAPAGSKRLKVRSLLKKFGFVKRSDRNTAEITRLLDEQGISIHPPLIRFGDSWKVGYEDWIYLSDQRACPLEKSLHNKVDLPEGWQDDEWFTRMLKLELRTEKEVEIKFIVPLLKRLGYEDEDRFDGMPVPAAHGSRATTLVIDFAVFNSASDALRSQPLLTVEAKHETRFRKQKEIANARNQAQSYCLWTQCDFFMVTDGRTIEVFDLTRRTLSGVGPVFSCGRHELKEAFPNLYRLIGKPVLTRHYLSKFSSVEEVS
ncbi:MAG TPA: type I restriction enzyme HsdR N-terminal domain-containing protein [Longimicrobiales bacterium]